MTAHVRRPSDLTALKRYARRGDASKINQKWIGKVGRILGALRRTRNWIWIGWHELDTPRKGTFAVWITRNWRITYKWDDAGPYDVDMEDYHRLLIRTSWVSSASGSYLREGLLPALGMTIRGSLPIT